MLKNKIILLLSTFIFSILTACASPVETFEVDDEMVRISPDESYQIEYSIVPEESDNSISWTVEDGNIATVDESGKVLGLSDGNTKLKAIAGDFENIVNIEISSSPNLKNVFAGFVEQNDLEPVEENSLFYMTVADDGSYIEIDSNPLDMEDFHIDIAFDAVKYTNKELGFSDSLFLKMSQTRALDGTQSDSNEYINVLWTYHPNKGLSVIYELKN